MSQPVLYTSFAGTSSVVLTDGMVLGEDEAMRSIGASTTLGYSTLSLRIRGRDGSRTCLVATLAAGKVSSLYDFVDIYCGSAAPDYA